MTDVYAVDSELDMAPMIAALRLQPYDFEFSNGWLVHAPSRHRYRFDRRGRVSIDAHCGCALLAARRDQEPDLHAAFVDWREGYWRTVETNREFASHFAPVGRWRRFARDIRTAFRRLLRPAASEAAAVTAYPAPAE